MYSQPLNRDLRPCGVIFVLSTSNFCGPTTTQTKKKIHIHIAQRDQEGAELYGEYPLVDGAGTGCSVLFVPLATVPGGAH